MVEVGKAGIRSHLLMGVAAGALTFAALPSIAMAQNTPAPASAPEASDSDEKVVVTARKRKESLQDAPVAVTAFTPSTMERLNIQSIDDVARFTPGLSFSKTFGRGTDRPVVRGQSNVLANVQFGVESGTAYFVDGMYYGGSIQSIDLGDVARVEVIKGPQSALFGRNTYAGAINFITKTPGEEFDVDVSARAGSRGLYEFKGSFDAPVTDKLGVRVSMRSYSYGGEYWNVATNKKVGQENSDSIAGAFSFRPWEEFELRVRASYGEDDDGPLPIFLQPAAQNNCFPGYRSLFYRTTSGSANNFQYFCGVIQPAKFVNLNTDPVVNSVPVAGVPAGAANSPLVIGGTYNLADGTAFDGIERNVFLFGAKAKWDIAMSGYELEFDFARRKEDEKQGYDSDHSGVNVFLGPPATTEAFFANTGRDDISENVYEVRFSTPSDHWLRASFGLFYFDQHTEGYDITFLDPFGERSLDDILDVDNKAAFGLVEADLTDEFTATLEARYAEEEKRFVDLTAATGVVTFNGKAKFHRATPRVTLRWKPEKNLTFYAIYAEGVKPGGLNGSAGAGVGRPTYDQETSRNQEIGMKAEWLGGNLTTNVAGYHINAKNVQLTTPIASPLGALTSIVTNQGTGETWGLEFDFRAIVNENFNFGGTYSWTEPKFVNGCDEDQWALTSGGGILAGGAVAPGTGTSHFGLTGNCSIAGKLYPLVPQHQATLNAEYRSDPIAEGSMGPVRVVLQGDLTYESTKYVQVHNLAETGETTLLGARLGLEGETWSLFTYGRNLTDEDTVTLATRWLQMPYGAPLVTSGSITAPVGTSQRGFPRAFFAGLRDGRSFGLELKYNF